MMLVVPHNSPHATSTTRRQGTRSRPLCSRASVRQHKVHSIQPSPFNQSLQLPRAQAASSAAAQQHDATAASSDGTGSFTASASILETDDGSSSTTTKGPAEEVWEYEAPEHVQQRNAEFVEQQLRGRVILAPLTKGGNLPFRCVMTQQGAGAMLYAVWHVFFNQASPQMANGTGDQSQQPDTVLCWQNTTF